MRFLLVLAVLAGAARADGFYYSEQVGNTVVKDELSAYLPNAMRVRVALGLRHEHWALEGFFAGDLNDTSRVTELTTYGVDLKYLQPIASHFDLYLRGSASAAMTRGGELEGYRGRGLGFGAGIQLKGKVRALGFLWLPLFFTGIGPKVTAALFIDDGYDFYRLHGAAQTAVDAQLSRLSFGFAVGSDF